MFRPVSALQTPTGRPTTDHITLRIRALAPWCAFVAAVLLSLALGTAILQRKAPERSSVASVARSHGLARKGLLSLPLTAQGPVSAALGADGHAYRVSRSEGGLVASSPAQHLSTSFTRSGVSVRSETTQVGFSLLAIGYGSTPALVGQVTPSAHANRVLYRHPGLSEWYANGPLGLEQGFTIPRAPAVRPDGPLTLAMALSGNLHPTLASGGKSIMLSQAGKAVLRYSGLTATDASGRTLNSWLQFHAGSLLLRVDTRGARYPLRIDPLLQKLTGAGELGNGEFGESVALSSDGNTAVIGGPTDDNFAGAVWVFTRSGSTWTQQGSKLTPSDESGNGYFGTSVALSADGNTALIGDPYDNFAGAVWVFTRSGSTWTQQGSKLTPSDEVGEGSFGQSVALSSDGNTAVIGGFGEGAWVFTRSGSAWTQQGSKLTGSGESGMGEFGDSVALSADGNTAVIGDPLDNRSPDASHGVGATWVFTRLGSTWTQQGSKLTGSGEIGYGDFGTGLALSADGNTALIGGSEDNQGVGREGVGAAWVFTRSGSTWTQQGSKLTGSDEVGEARFGLNGALSGDGNTALVGGYKDNGQAGAAWVFTRSGSTWTQQGSKLTGSGEIGGGGFGLSVSLSSDANTGVIGGYYDNGGVGAAWVFMNAEAAGQMPLDGGAVTPESMRGGGGLCPRCLMKAIIHTIFGAPVDTEDGNMYHTFNDIYVPGRGFPLAFTRTYNSNAAATNGPLGYGWVDNLSASLASSGTTAVLTEENGAQTTFTLNGSSWTAPPRNIASLTHNPDGTWTLVRQGQQTLTFDGAGRLTSMKDLNGYTTSYSYTGGQLTTVTDAAGRTIRLGYSGGHLTTVTDANVTPNRVVTFQYDAAGNLTDVIDVNGGHTQFTYDNSHRMLTMKDPNCFATAACIGIQNAYDSQGRVVSQTDELKRTTRFAYAGDPSSAAGGTTTVTDPRDNVTVDTYEYGVKVSETRGYGTPQAGTTTYRYDPVTVEPVSITDANGHTTTMTYDSSGNLLTRTDPLHRATTNTYDTFNDLLTIRDPLGVTTTMTYDSHGNLLSRSRPLTGTAQVQATTYTYGDSSHPSDVTSMTDPEGKTWHYTYDTYGDCTSTTDPLGNKTTSTYNPIGWLLTTVIPRGNASGANPASYTTTYAHNNFGQITETVDPLGHKTTSQYDPDRNLIASTDADGNTTAYTYDAADEQTAVHRADGTTRQTTYWPDGTVKEQIDGAGHMTLYEYDPLGRASAVTDPLGRTTRYGYDAAGNRVTITDPEGRVTTTTYDAANEPTSVTYSDGKTPNVTRITYDADGQRTAEADGSGAWSWTWDSLHRLTSVIEGNSGTVKYQYDLRNNPTVITYPNGETVTRSYDDAGRWTSVTDWLGNTTTFSYDPDGNLTREKLPSGTGITDTSTYANDDTLSSISDTRGPNTLLEANYTRDANRQLSSDSSLSAPEGSYSYTALNQLCYAGNATTPCSAPPPGPTPYKYDSADNLIRLGVTTQTFDAAGELTSASAPPEHGEPPPGGGGGSNGGGGSVAKKEPVSPVEPRTVPTVTSGKVAFARSTRHGRSLISPALSTHGAGDLVLAFICATGPLGGPQAVAVKGGALKWSFVTSASFHGAYVAIWQARAHKRLTRMHVSVTLHKSGFPAALSAAAFDSKAAVVRHAKGSGSRGAPRVAVTVPSDALVWAIGQDATRHVKVKPLNGQTLVANNAFPGGGTSWIQSTNSPATGRVMIGDSAPTSASWALGVATIQEQAATAARAAAVTTNPLATTAIPAVVPPGTQQLFAAGLVEPQQFPTTADGTLTYTYDAEGDRTGISASDGTSQTLAYNQALELTGTGNGVSFAYNGDGLRMTKTVGGTAIPFVWDIAGRLPTLIGDGTNTYVYGPGGLPVEQINGSTALWLHHDQLGSTRLLTDATGQTVATYVYTPYGHMSSSSGSASTPMLFAGQYRDSESGLYYLRARYYDPASAQFLTRDPAEGMTLSPYGYASNSPVTLTDPSGNESCLPVGAAGPLLPGEGRCPASSSQTCAALNFPPPCLAPPPAPTPTAAPPSSAAPTSMPSDPWSGLSHRFCDANQQCWTVYGVSSASVVLPDGRSVSFDGCNFTDNGITGPNSSNAPVDIGGPIGDGSVSTAGPSGTANCVWKLVNVGFSDQPLCVPASAPEAQDHG